jgi:hypothetical protein
MAKKLHYFDIAALKITPNNTAYLNFKVTFPDENIK